MRVGKEAGYVLCEECRHRKDDDHSASNSPYMFHGCEVRPNEDFVAGAFQVCGKWEAAIDD